MKLATATAKVRNAGFDTYTAGTGVLMVRLTNRPVDSIEVWRVLAEADADEYAPEYENIDGEVAVTGLELR